MDRTPSQGKPLVSRPSTSSGPSILGRWHVPFFYGWVIVGVCFVAEFLTSGLGGSTISLFFKPMKDDLGWSLTQLVGATTAATLAGIVVVPFLGGIIDRFGVKPVMLWGTVAAGAGMLTMMAVHEVWQFWVLYACVSALGLSEIGQLTSSAAVAQWFNRKRGRALATSTVGQPIGNVVMAPVMAAVIVWLGWREAWGFMALLLLVTMLPLTLIFMRNRPEDTGLRPDGEPAPRLDAPGELFVGTERHWTVREAMRTRSLWALLSVFVLGGGLGAVTTNLAPFFIEQEGMSPARVGWVFSGFMASATIARITWGFLVERLSPRFCLFTVSLGRGLGIVSLVVVPYPWNMASFMVLCGMVGGAFGILQPVIFGNYFGRRSFASIQGGMRPFLALPGLTLPLLVSHLFDIQGSFNFGFILAGIITGLGAVAALFAVAPPPKPPAVVVAAGMG